MGRSDDFFSSLFGGPYRAPPEPGWICPSCKRRMDALNNARRLGPQTVCVPCYELICLKSKLTPQVTRLVTAMTDEQRLELMEQWFGNYCRYCGTDESERTCHCNNDE